MNQRSLQSMADEFEAIGDMEIEKDRSKKSKKKKKSKDKKSNRISNKFIDDLDCIIFDESTDAYENHNSNENLIAINLTKNYLNHNSNNQKSYETEFKSNKDNESIDKTTKEISQLNNSQISEFKDQKQIDKSKEIELNTNEFIDDNSDNKVDDNSDNKVDDNSDNKVDDQVDVQVPFDNDNDEMLKDDLTKNMFEQSNLDDNEQMDIDQTKKEETNCEFIPAKSVLLNNERNVMSNVTNNESNEIDDKSDDKQTPVKSSKIKKSTNKQSINEKSIEENKIETSSTISRTRRELSKSSSKYESPVENTNSKRRKCTKINDPLRFIKNPVNTPTIGLKIGLSRNTPSSKSIDLFNRNSSSSTNEINRMGNIETPKSAFSGLKLGLSRNVSKRKSLHPELFKDSNL